MSTTPTSGTENLIGYARVSTRDQDTTYQVNALQNAGCHKIYEETASGVTQGRPQLQKALDYIRDGETLVVWKLDRLARSMKQLVETLEVLNARQIGFRSISEHIDTTTPGGKLVFHIFAAVAEFERDLIRERTNAGLQSARDRGLIGGRPRALSDDLLAQIMAQLTNPKISVEDVARQHGVSRTTIYRHLPCSRAELIESGSHRRSTAA